MEIGPFPTEDRTCTKWKNTYSENGTVVNIKDYQLCRGNNASDLYIDEGADVKLASQYIGDVLVTPFRYDRLLLITQTRLLGDTLQEEILTINDVFSTQGIQSLTARLIQRITMKRVC